MSQAREDVYVRPKIKSEDETGGLVWYALRVPPEQRLMELTVSILRGRGLLAGISMEMRYRRKTKRQAEREKIPFITAPGYVLVGYLDGVPFPWRTEKRRGVMDLHLVRSVVGVNGCAARLDSAATMDFLRVRDDRIPGYQRFLRTGKEFDIGDRVIITEGPLAEWTDTAPIRVHNIEDGEAVFMVKLLGKDKEIRVPVDRVVRAA